MLLTCLHYRHLSATLFTNVTECLSHRCGHLSRCNGISLFVHFRHLSAIHPPPIRHPSAISYEKPIAYAIMRAPQTRIRTERGRYDATE